MGRRFIIIGNGIAGITTAATLADSAPDAEILVYSDEKHPYYRRPWLPDFLAGNRHLEELYAYPDAWYAKRRIQAHLNHQVAEIAPAEQHVVLASGEKVRYDKLLLSCEPEPLRSALWTMPSRYETSPATKKRRL